MLKTISFLLILFILGFTAGVVFILLKLKGGAKWIRVLEADIEQAQERAEKLERDLKHKQDEIDYYKEKVTVHFTKTAELFNALTNNYRAIYEHMTKGTHELCSSSVMQLSSQMSNERLLTQTENETQKSIEGDIGHPSSKPAADSPSIAAKSGTQTPSESTIMHQPSSEAPAKSPLAKTKVKPAMQNPVSR